MDKQSGSEMYALSQFRASHLRGALESWDFGRKHALPLWPEFAGGQCFHEGNYYTHLCPSSTAFELPLLGELRIEHNGRTIVVKPGFLYILPAGEPNTLRPGPSGECWKLSFGLCGQMVAPLLATLGFSREQNLIELTAPDKLRQMIESMLPLLRRKEEKDVPELAAQGFRLLMALRMQQPFVADPLVANAIRIFEFNLAKPIELGVVAEELEVSELKLIRQFKKHLGITPRAYLIKMRMRKVAALLGRSTLSIGEIALMCGYSSSHCLAREFRKYHGVSPRKFRLCPDKAGCENVSPPGNVIEAAELGRESFAP